MISLFVGQSHAPKVARDTHSGILGKDNHKGHPFDGRADNIRPSPDTLIPLT